MSRKIFKDGDIFYAADANTVGNPILDAGDFYGHGAKVIDEWLDDGINSIKSRFYNWYNRFLVTVTTGLNVSVTGGIAVKSGGSVVNIPPQNMTVFDNAVSYLYIGSLTSDSSIKLRLSNNLPTNCLPLAQITSLNGVITSLQDLRDPNASIIPADSPQTIFTGFVIPSFQTAGVPQGFLECNGQEVSRLAYPDLFAMIGTAYGVGNGFSTFNIPNTQGRFLLTNNQLGLNVGATGGSFVQTITNNNLPSHSHDIDDFGHGHGVTQSPHGHGVNDPTHNHYVNDPGHLHHWEYIMAGLDTYVGIYPANGNSQVGETTMANNTFINTTGIWLNGSPTGINIQPVNANVGVVNSVSNLNIRNTGNGQPLNTAPPYIIVRYFIKY